MATTDDRADPLVGRGSARRTGPEGGDPVVDDPGRPRERSLPRPSLTRSWRARPANLRDWLRLDGRTPSARLVLGIALLAFLAVAWMRVGGARSSARPTLPPASTTTTIEARQSATPTESPVAVPRWVPDAIAATCRARGSVPSKVVVVDCTPGRGVIALQYRGFATATALHSAYDAQSPRGGGTGPAGCARGAGEERSWSVSRSPSVPSGRYRCSVVEGRAQLVWTSEGSRVLAIASRADGDLRSLYQWWTTVPGPHDPGDRDGP